MMLSPQLCLVQMLTCLDDLAAPSTAVRQHDAEDGGADGTDAAADDTEATQEPAQRGHVVIIGASQLHICIAGPYLPHMMLSVHL